MYRSPNIVRVIKARRLRWVGHVVIMEEGRRAFNILTGTSAGKRPLYKKGNLSSMGTSLEQMIGFGQRLSISKHHREERILLKTFLSVLAQL